MHYIIDGYNMLFRLPPGRGNLQHRRQAIIVDLNKKISLLKLDVSIVFDATFQMGERTRSHYDQLEIIFSAEGETADSYILDELKHASQPKQIIVVTSDKILAAKVKGWNARTESVEEFLVWVNRSYKNKLRQQKKVNKVLAPSGTVAPQPEEGQSFPKETHDYQNIFETRFQNLMEAEKELSKEKKSIKRPPRTPKKKKNRFEEREASESQEATEMERWLKLFESRLKH